MCPPGTLLNVMGLDSAHGKWIRDTKSIEEEPLGSTRRAIKGTEAHREQTNPGGDVEPTLGNDGAALLLRHGARLAGGAAGNPGEEEEEKEGQGSSLSHAGSRCSITATPHFPGSSRTGPGVRLWARGALLGLAETLLGGTGLLEPVTLTPQAMEGAALAHSMPCPALCLAPPRAFCSP